MASRPPDKDAQETKTQWHGSKNGSLAVRFKELVSENNQLKKENKELRSTATMQELSPNEFAVTIGFDAFRIAIGISPKRHSVESICRWLLTMAANKQKQIP